MDSDERGLVVVSLRPTFFVCVEVTRDKSKKVGGRAAVGRRDSKQADGRAARRRRTARVLGQSVGQSASGPVGTSSLSSSHVMPAVVRASSARRSRALFAARCRQSSSMLWWSSASSSSWVGHSAGRLSSLSADQSLVASRCLSLVLPHAAAADADAAAVAAQHRIVELSSCHAARDRSHSQHNTTRATRLFQNELS